MSQTEKLYRIVKKDLAKNDKAKTLPLKDLKIYEIFLIYNALKISDYLLFISKF